MVVGNNDVQPHSLCLLYFGQAGNPAVDGDHEPDALLAEVLQCRGFQTVTFGQAVRYIRNNSTAERGKALNEEGRCRDAISVIVTVYGDWLSGKQSLVYPGYSPVHIRQQQGVIAEAFIGIEKRCYLCGFFQAAIEQELGDKGGNT